MANPLINNEVYDFSVIKVEVPGLGIAINLTEINYSDSVDKTMFYGAAQHALAQTNGQYSCEAGFTVKKQDHSAYIRALKLLAAAQGGNITAIEFDITVAYGSFTAPPTVDIIKGCGYGGSEQSNSTGSDAIVTPVTLTPRLILWDGVNPLGQAALDMGGI